MNPFVKHHVIYWLVIASLFSCIIYLCYQNHHIIETFKDVSWFYSHSAQRWENFVDLLKKNTDFNHENHQISAAKVRRIIQNMQVEARLQNILSYNIHYNPEEVLRGNVSVCQRPVLLNAGIYNYYDESDMDRNFRQIENLHQGFIIGATLLLPIDYDLDGDCFTLKINGRETISIPTSKWLFAFFIGSYGDYHVYVFMIPCQIEGTEIRQEYQDLITRLRKGVTPVLLPKDLLESNQWIKTMKLQYNDYTTEEEIQIFDFPLTDF